MVRRGEEVRSLRVAKKTLAAKRRKKSTKMEPLALTGEIKTTKDTKSHEKL
jgi:hypothetical protein